MWYQNVPSCSALEAIAVAAARHDRVLGHARNAVFCVRNVDPVPVDGDAAVDVLVPERDLDEVAVVHAEAPGPGLFPLKVSASIVRPDGSLSVPCRAVSVKSCVGLAVLPSFETRDADLTRVVAGRNCAAAEVVGAVVHGVVGARQPAVSTTSVRRRAGRRPRAAPRPRRAP